MSGHVVNTRYNSFSKFLHWLLALLIITLLFIGYFMFDITDKPRLLQVINIHKLTGLTILILMIIRAAWALNHPKPPLSKDTPLWQRFAERVVQISFYVVLIAMPLAGWIMSCAAGHCPQLFSYQIVLPVPHDKAIAHAFEAVHNTLAIVLIVLISIHVLAAFYHFFIKKDDVLQRMLPGSD